MAQNERRCNHAALIGPSSLAHLHCAHARRAGVRFGWRTRLRWGLAEGRGGLESAFSSPSFCASP